MKHPSSILVITVAIIFCWSLPQRFLSHLPTFSHPVVMAVPDGPFDQSYILPEPLRVAIANEWFTDRPPEERNAEFNRPAWILFIGTAAWSFLMISDCSERLTLGTLAVLKVITPVALVATTVSVALALGVDREVDPTGEFDESDNDAGER